MNSFTIVSLYSFENEAKVEDLQLIVDPDMRCWGGILQPYKIFVVPCKLGRPSAEKEVFTK